MPKPHPEQPDPAQPDPAQPDPAQPGPEPNLAARVVLTTAADAEEANRLARSLVEEGLAACATLVPAVRSIYRWQGAIEEATEVLIILKTGAAQIPVLEARLRALHSYQTPEFLVLPVESGSADYLEWLARGLRHG
ncbi:MAG: divalent cation tolerance protein CutA [Terracidiphilus sp.]